MAQKQLRDLLGEDQEPFFLQTYVADRTSRPNKPRKLVKPSQPAKAAPTFAGAFCKTVCLFSALPDSPDPRKSPLFHFATAASPLKSPNKIFLHVPAKTAALLLDAAVRIQQKTSVKPKPAKKGLLGSFLKRLTHRTRPTPGGIETDKSRRSFGVRVSRGDATEDRNVEKQCVAEKSGSPSGCRGHSRRSSGLWSESNGERSLDLETSTSGSDSIELIVEEEDELYAALDDHSLCGSPFRFVLRRSPPSSSGERTPDFASPAASPPRCDKKDIDVYGDIVSSEILKTQEEEEETEQCSPVSVLEPPFEDGHDHEEEYDDDNTGFDYECSFANVQRAKQKLLEKLRRFERLAELDPIELEKRMLELDDEEDDDDDYVSRASEDFHEPEEFKTDQCVSEVLKSRFDNVKKIPNDMKRLVSDLVAEEQGMNNEVGVTVMRRVCERFDSWKRVDLNTIDMMVEKDFRMEIDGWAQKPNEYQVTDIVSGIEAAVFGLLMEEVLEDSY